VEFHLVKKYMEFAMTKITQSSIFSAPSVLKMMKLPSVKSLLIRALSNTTNRAPIALKI
jgi:hypothetical protein